MSEVLSKDILHTIQQRNVARHGHDSYDVQVKPDI
jgi:hypothetical protein